MEVFGGKWILLDEDKKEFMDECIYKCYICGIIKNESYYNR